MQACPCHSCGGQLISGASGCAACGATVAGFALESAQPGVSRRALLKGLASVVAVGGVAPWLVGCQDQPQAANTNGPSTRTPGDAGAVVYRGHTAGVNAVAWSPDGVNIASASDDGTVQVWNAQTG